MTVHAHFMINMSLRFMSAVNLIIVVLWNVTAIKLSNMMSHAPLVNEN